MKFIMCNKCGTMATPSKANVNKFLFCSCKQSAICYTDRDKQGRNIAGIVGDVTILGIDDGDLEAMKDGSTTVANVYKINRDASTIIDMDAEVPAHAISALFNETGIERTDDNADTDDECFLIEQGLDQR